MTRPEFEQMAARLREEVMRVSSAFFGSAEDAEDAAQEAMVQLWRYCERIDSGRNVRALAVRVAKNCCVSSYRRQLAAQRMKEQSALLEPPADSSPQEQLEAEDARRMMEETVALLKPRERQLFEMRQMEGLSTSEIAAETGIPQASVAAMVSAARKKVFNELTKRLRQ